MTLEAMLREAVLPIVPICEPELYEGEAEEYCTFNATEIPEGFGDNGPRAIRYLFQLHWFLPRGKRPMKTKRELCRAVLEAGFTYPSVENASDQDSQHFVLEFEGIDGDV